MAWLAAAADAIDKIEGELVASLIRFIGKPRRAATFEAKRVGAFIRAFLKWNAQERQKAR